MKPELCDMGNIRHPQNSELTTCNHHHHANKGHNNFYPSNIYTTAMNSSPHARLAEASVVKNQTRQDMSVEQNTSSM
jgi:hypothetical protein